MEMGNYTIIYGTWYDLINVKWEIESNRMEIYGNGWFDWFIWVIDHHFVFFNDFGIYHMDNGWWINSNYMS